MSLDHNALDSLKIERRHTPTPPSGFSLKWLLVALTAAVLVTAAYRFLYHPALEVESTTVLARSTAGGGAVLNASGYVVARRQATVSAKVTGKIVEVMIEEGMTVAKDQLLARLDDQTVRPVLQLAEKQLEAAQKDLSEVEVREAEAERNLHRVEQLSGEKLVSESQLDQAQTEVAAQKARLVALQGSVSVAAATVRVRNQDLDDLLVRAPFAGVIISKDAQPGEMVSPISAGGGFTRTGVATIVDMDSREIEVDVNEAFINRVSTGQKTQAVLDAYQDWIIPSHVINIVPTADRQKATVKVRIGFDQLDPRILPNMGVKVGFLEESGVTATAAKPALLVPVAAVIKDGAASIVWRVRDGRVERVAVQAGSESDGSIVLLAGVNAGDEVVARPVAGLTDGAAVTTRARPAAGGDKHE